MSFGPTANTQDYTTSTNLIVVSGAFSVACWIKVTSLTGGGVAWCTVNTPGGTNAAWVKLGYPAGGTPYLEYTSAGAQANIGGGALGTTSWEWFCVTHDGSGTAKIYRSVAGAAVALQLTQAVNWSGAAASFTNLFNDEGNLTRLRGQMLAYKEWSVQLSLNECQNEMTSMIPRRTANLNRWLPLLNATQGAKDWSGNGFDMTRTGVAFTDAATMPPIGWGGVPIRSL